MTKKLENYSLNKTNSRNLLSNPNGGFLTPEAEKTRLVTITVEKLKKKWQKLSKNAKISDVKILKNILLI